MVVNCKTFAEGKMKKQPTIGHYEYHSMFHVGEKEYDVYSVYHDREVPEFFDIFDRNGEHLNQGSPIYAEDPEWGPTLDQLIKFTQ